MDARPKPMGIRKKPSLGADYVHTPAVDHKTIKRKRILIINSEDGVKFVFCRMLSLMGYDVVITDSGDEGLNLFFEEPFDLLMTDIRLPGLDGWTLASKVKRKSPNTSVVLISAQDEKGILGKIEGSSADLIMFKPISLKDVQRAVRGVLRTA